ncbi:MAG: hypothetical protein M0D55_11975 [Elusimicrobiota bacterium]|nr:MAG: hypothetical protein M0D55_11975 [Elusimicrobiota bacterium]
MKILLPLLAALAVPVLAQEAPVPKPFFAYTPATPTTVAIVRVSSTLWSPKFPLKKEQVVEAARKAGTKDASRFTCEWREGADKATCDFAYDVWPEMCWYGYDHSYADVSLKDPANPVVTKREWLAN